MPILLFLNLLQIAYIGTFKPLSRKLDNRIDLFNEFIVDCCTIYSLTSTDWINNKSSRATYGYHVILLLGILIALNVSIILYFSGRGIYFGCVNQYHKKHYMEYKEERRQRRLLLKALNKEEKKVLREKKRIDREEEELRQ